MFVFLWIISASIISSSPVSNPTNNTLPSSPKEPSEQLRPTWVEVNLTAVELNVRHLKKYITDKVHLMAIVKANAYGHGMLQIARTSIRAGATWLGVATLDEALTLRSHVTHTLPILALGYVPSQHLHLAVENNITVTGISVDWMREAVRVVQRPLDFHLKIDTGMNRLGVKTVEEVNEVIRLVANNTHLRFKGVYTHFATAEDVNNRTYFLHQKQLFDEFLTMIPNRSEKIVHCANSGATLYHPEPLFYDMVRCGKAVMGPPNEALKGRLPIPLQTAISLHSAIALIKQVEGGAKIGYLGEYTTNGSEWIATIPIGYGDGWHQNFRAPVLVNGRRMPIIGRISMDQLMIRVDQYYPVGTRVTFIGTQDNETITGDEVAATAKMPRSEIFSSLTNRVPRVYFPNDTTDTNQGNSFAIPSYLIGTSISIYLIQCAFRFVE